MVKLISTILWILKVILVGPSELEQARRQNQRVMSRPDYRSCGK